MALSTENAVIEICGLTKKYGTKKAVDNISLSVKRGEVLGFLGPNGAGKSTTMNILTGYISATSGKALVDGIDVLEDPKTVKTKIGYLPENPPLYFDMTVIEYLNFVYELKKVTLPRKEHLAEIMKTVKIDGVSDRMIKNLSKGYKQRVGLAQALIGNPEVLILDEPTVGLDPKQIIEIRDVIKVLGKDRTVILSTHILQEVTAVCDRVAIINHGKLVAMDSLKNLSARFGEKGMYLIRVLGSKSAVKALLEGVDGLKTIRYVASSEPETVDFKIAFKDGLDLRKRIFEVFSAANLPILEFKSMDLTLEEIFIKVTNDENLAVIAENDEKKEATKDESDI